MVLTMRILYYYHYLVRAGFSFELSDHLENPEHHPREMGCNTLTPKDIRLSNIHQTTNSLMAWPLSEKSLLCMVVSCACLWAKAFPLIIIFMSRTLHSSSRNLFYVFSCDAVSAQDLNLSAITFPATSRCAMCWAKRRLTKTIVGHANPLTMVQKPFVATQYQIYIN